MELITSISELKRKLNERKNQLAGSGQNSTVGFVPTMGYLHRGHISLVEAARQKCGIVVLSIFVNPLQFGPNEDYETYPRDLENDLRIAAEAGVDFVFAPGVGEMYPRYPLDTIIKVNRISEPLCGASRPGHFDGVATVVAKLFNIVKPDYAFFGMKDAQQVAVVTQMAADLNMDVRIVPCPTVREPDGLAMSSRNVYLSAEERKQATVLWQTLRKLDDWIALPGITAGELKHKMAEHIQTAPMAKIDYVDLRTYPSLEELDESLPAASIRQPVLAALAVRFGKTRLIDNRLIFGEVDNHV